MTSQAPPAAYFNAPLHTSYDLPPQGSKEAPKTFRGKYMEVQNFIDHYERLLNKCRVQSDHEKCQNILMYCSVDVRYVIQTLEGYEAARWSKLKKEILRHYDADQVFQKHKPADVEGLQQAA
jgi:hypothetical protein